MESAEKNEYIANFVQITGASEENATMCLTAAEWNLAAAVDLYYQDSSLVDQREATDVDRVQETVASKPPTQSRFATLGSLRTAEDTDSSEEEGQAFYAGGSERGGGQQVLGPKRKKDAQGIIKDMFKAAKEHGAEEAESGSSSAVTQRGRPTTFVGAGYRLGESEGDSAVVEGAAAPEPRRQVDMVLKLWRNGFSVDDGELRDFRDPSNQQFLAAIKNGEVPHELRRLARGGEVNLSMEDHKDEEYVAPKKAVKAFSGEGNRLGSAAPTVLASASPADQAKSDESAKAGVSLDKTKPVTSIQIRLADGSRMVAQFNHSHTVADIRHYILSARPQYAASHFALMTTFPNKELTQETQSLDDAKLLNAVIVQRIK